MSASLAEIEYYYEGGNHHDTFTHCDPLQQTTYARHDSQQWREVHRRCADVVTYCRANWYFHKSGATYKGGSYKGLDITFGGTPAPLRVTYSTLRF